MQSVKPRLWETINKQLNFFYKQTERKKKKLRCKEGICILNECGKHKIQSQYLKPAHGLKRKNYEMIGNLNSEEDICY